MYRWGAGPPSSHDSLPVNHSKDAGLAPGYWQTGTSPEISLHAGALLRFKFIGRRCKTGSGGWWISSRISRTVLDVTTRLKMAKNWPGDRCFSGNFVLGTRVPDLSGKFQLSINHLSRKQFLVPAVRRKFSAAGDVCLLQPARSACRIYTRGWPRSGGGLCGWADNKKARCWAGRVISRRAGRVNPSVTIRSE